MVFLRPSRNQRSRTEQQVVPGRELLEASIVLQAIRKKPQRVPKTIPALYVSDSYFTVAAMASTARNDSAAIVRVGFAVAEVGNVPDPNRNKL